MTRGHAELHHAIRLAAGIEALHHDVAVVHRVSLPVAQHYVTGLGLRGALSLYQKPGLEALRVQHIARETHDLHGRQIRFGSSPLCMSNV